MATEGNTQYHKGVRKDGLYDMQFLDTTRFLQPRALVWCTDVKIQQSAPLGQISS
jgi:hypothetical protein